LDIVPFVLETAPNCIDGYFKLPMTWPERVFAKMSTCGATPRILDVSISGREGRGMTGIAATGRREWVQSHADR
jgi:hypothetical protein